MIAIPEATLFILTGEERAGLNGLMRSRNTEHRLRQRAQIVLLAAEGLATRAIARAAGCTTGTASKWRVRYASMRRGPQIGRIHWCKTQRRCFEVFLLQHTAGPYMKVKGGPSQPKTIRGTL